MKKKIIFLIPSLHGGGAERVYTHLLHHIDREKFEPYLMVVNLEGPYVEDIPSDVKIVDLKKRSVKSSLIKLIKEINKIRPSIIMSTLLHLNLTLLFIKPFLKGNPRIIVREANPPSFSIKELLGTSVFKKLYVKLYKRADHIIAISKDVAEDVIETFNVPKDRVHIIYNPVLVEQIKMKSEEDVNHPWIINKKEPVIISIGRLVEQKDFPTLIKAFAKVIERKKCKLIILGEGPNYSILLELIKELGIEDSVDFLGFVNNPYKYVKNSDLFVLSSKWEGFGMVIIEALAVGTPVVATDCPGGPHEILNNGKFGKIVPVGDIGKMSQAIIEALDEEIDRGRLIKRAMDYDINVIKLRYQEVFYD